MPAIGDLAPDFTLPTDDGELTLSSMRGRHVVLYFYPKDSTPGCTTEARDFRDLLEAFRAAGAEVIGGSADSVQRHCNFRDKNALNFPLVSDPEHVALEAYGVWQEKKNYGRTYMGIVRSTFLIDSAGVVRQIWSKVRVKGHAQAVLEAVQSLGLPQADA